MESVARVGGGAPGDPDRLVGRAGLLEAIGEVLWSARPWCCVLVGDRWVGTTTVAEAVAEMLVERGITVRRFAGLVMGGAPRGVVLADDLEAFGPEERRELERLAADPAAGVVVTVRAANGALPDAAAALMRLAHSVRFQVEPLDGRACAEMAWRRVGGAFDLSAGMRLRALTRGRPGLLDRVLAAAESTGERAGGAWWPTADAVRRELTATEGARQWEQLAPSTRALIASTCRRGVLIVDETTMPPRDDVVAAVASDLLVDRHHDIDTGQPFPRVIAPAPWLDCRQVAEWCPDDALAAPDGPDVRARLDGLLWSAVAMAFDSRARYGQADTMTLEARQRLASTVIGLALPGASDQLIGMARLELLLGRASSALGLLVRAYDIIERSGRVATGGGARRRASGGAAVALCWLGDVDSAQRWVARYDEVPVADSDVPDLIAARWRANVDSFLGDRASAVRRLGEALHDADSIGAAEDAVLLAFDLVCLDELPDRAIVERARSQVTEPMASAMLSFVDAALSGGLLDLMSSTDQLEQLGANRFAVEAWAYCAALADAAGDHPVRLRCARRVTRLRRTGTSGWVVSPQSLRQEVCTPREYEVAALAADGATRQDIADQLSLTRDAVDRHLESVYGRLAVTDRHELAAALADLGVR